MYNLKRKLVVEVKPPGYLLKRLDEELSQKWNERNRLYYNYEASSGSRGSSHDSSKSKQKQINVTNVDGGGTQFTRADGSESARSRASSHR
jgi:hypothetical protein